MVPADGGFTVAVQKGDHKAGEIQGQTRMHALLYYLLGLKQLIVCINKMDSPTVNYSEERFNEVRDEIKHMLKSVGWNKDFVDKSVPVLPISGLAGDNLFKPSDKMPWFKGTTVETSAKSTVQVITLHDALDLYVQLPKRNLDAPFRMPVSGLIAIKGIGDVITGRIEQGTLKPGDEVVFLPKNTDSNSCSGKVFTIEMHHKSVDRAGPGDNIGINIRGLPKDYKPGNGDIMILKKDDSLKVCKRLTAAVQVLEHPGELKVGYCPVGYIRTSHSAMKMVKINWRIGKDTQKQKVEDPVSIKEGDMTEIVFEPSSPIVVEEFAKCEGLGRIAIMDMSTVVMIGKITNVEF